MFGFWPWGRENPISGLRQSFPPSGSLGGCVIPSGSLGCGGSLFHLWVFKQSFAPLASPSLPQAARKSRLQWEIHFNHAFSSSPLFLQAIPRSFDLGCSGSYFNCEFWLVLCSFKQSFVPLTSPSLPQAVFCSFRKSRALDCNGSQFQLYLLISSSLLWKVLRSLRQSFAPSGSLGCGGTLKALHKVTSKLARGPLPEALTLWVYEFMPAPPLHAASFSSLAPQAPPFELH